MAEQVVLNGVVLLVERAGAGEPTVVFVHGSWDDHRTWNRVASAVDGTAVSYDRRGHSGSRQPLDQGGIDEDVDDLVALVEWLDHGPVAVVGHSYGATGSLLVACRRPDLVHHVVVHEPPLMPRSGRPWSPTPTRGSTCTGTRAAWACRSTARSTRRRVCPA